MGMTTGTGKIRIVEVTKDSILFDNGKKLVLHLEETQFRCC